MDIQVGDRVTYKDELEEEYTVIVFENDLEWFSNKLKDEKSIKILKIERPKYEVIKEKKELLTEEKEFLQSMIKYFPIDRIIFGRDAINFYGHKTIVNCSDYPNNLEFKGVERYKDYSFKELGLE